MPPIYYISEDFVKQLYAEHIGSPDTLEVAEEVEVGTNFYARAKAGMNNLLATLVGLEGNFEGGAEVSAKEAESETKTYQSNWEDEVLEVVKYLRESEQVRDISEVNPLEIRNELYSFDSKLKLFVEGTSKKSSQTDIAYAMAHGTDDSRNPVMIKATNCSGDVSFIGETSPSNWLSPSVLRNLTRGNSTRQRFSGIVHPLRVENRKGTPELDVQFICIGPDSLYQSET